MEVVIRSAILEDSNELLQLSNKLIHLSDWSNREVMLEQSLQDPNSKIYVSEVENKIVGFIEERFFPDFVEASTLGLIQSLIVDETYRKLGVGAKLLRKAIEEAERRNAMEIHVWMEFDNEQARNFYVKQEFNKRALLLERTD